MAEAEVGEESHSVLMAVITTPRNARLVYLITYSRVDAAIVSKARQSFADIVVDGFNNADNWCPCNVLQWVVSQELRNDGKGFTSTWLYSTAQK